jgi:multicomponent Na+:H+ antiporter subunit E
MIGYFCLCMTIWVLLTANFGWVNLLIGVLMSLLLSRGATTAHSWQELLVSGWKILLAIPQAYAEAIELILRPHTYETIENEPLPARRFATKGDTPGLVFLDIFLITFTPKTTVLRFQQQGQQAWYTIHRVLRRPKP